jgi:hypothetical protein
MDSALYIWNLFKHGTHFHISAFCIRCGCRSIINVVFYISVTLTDAVARPSLCGSAPCTVSVWPSALEATVGVKLWAESLRHTELLWTGVRAPRRLWQTTQKAVTAPTLSRRHVVTSYVLVTRIGDKNAVTTLDTMNVVCHQQAGISLKSLSLYEVKSFSDVRQLVLS